jgi:protein-S-isoprenylcysteine O-methyltransferase Ste14
VSVRTGSLVAQIAGMAVVFGLLLFVTAGTLAWPAGWAFLVLMFGFTIPLSLWLLRFNPELLAERMSGLAHPGQKRWDKVLVAGMFAVFFAWLVLMPLDAVRFRWSHLPAWLPIVGALLLGVSFWIFFLTFRENPYLSPAVRIQTERSHRVVSTGPYRYVRHPMYAGFALFAMGTALLLGSAYGVAGAFVLIGIVAVRAVLEEKVLREELPGYADYMQQVRFRFLRGVW